MNPNKIKVIHMGRATGKTTKGLIALSEAGGGIYVTRHPQEARMHAKRMRLGNVTVLAIDPNTNIFIDDVDDQELIVSTTLPLSLDFIETPQVIEPPLLS